MWPREPSWPFVGRDAPLDECLAALTAGQSVLLAGHAGIGKTYLARAIADVLETDDKVEVVRLVASVASELPPLARERAPTTILVVDDVQLLDDDNAATLHRWALDHGGRLLLTFRSHDGHRVPTPFDAMWREDALLRIDLEALDRSDVDLLARTVLDGPIEATTRDRLWLLTLGSPLYLRELLHAGIRSEAIVERSGFWTLDHTIVSPALDELIAHRINALGSAALRVVELVALGAPLGLSTFTATADPEAIAEAEASGLIDVVRDERRVDVHIGHPLYGDVVRRHLGGARAADRHHELVGMVESTPMRRRSDIVRAATWQLRSGGAVVSDEMVLAARRALYDRDEALALELARSTNVEQRVAAAIIESEALSNVGRHDQAEQLLREIGGTESEMHAALVANQRAIALFWGLGAADDAIDVLLRAEAKLPDGAWRRELTAERAVLIAMSGNASEAIEIARPLLGDEAARVDVTAAIAASVSMSVGCRASDAVELSRAAQVRSAQLNDQPMLSDPAIHVVAEALALSFAGEFQAAASLAQTGLAVSAAKGLREGQAWFSLVLGRIQLASGYFGDATVSFIEADGAFASQQSNGPRRWALAGKVVAAAARGEDEDRERSWAELAAVPEHPAQVMETEVQRAVAWRQRALGYRLAAKRTLYSAVDIATCQGLFGMAADALYDIVRLDLVDGDFTHARWDALGPVQGRLGAARLQLSRAVIDHNGSAAEDVAKDFVEMGSFLLGAEAAAIAGGLHSLRGDQRSAAAAWRHSVDLAAQLDDEWLLTLDRSTTRQALTPRECEIAELASAGRSNRDIADELSISVRTVENHLQKIYIKLGIRERAEIPTALI